MKINKTTPGVYRRVQSGALVAVVEATFIPVWIGPQDGGRPQYQVERSANRGTAVGYCYSLEDAKSLCRLLNGGEAAVK